MCGDANQDEAWSYSGPALAIIHGERREPLLTLYDVSQHQHHTRVSREFANKTVYGSYRDWLLVKDNNAEDKQELCIINVVTMQRYQLPPMSENEYISLWGSIFLMSGSPVDDVAFTVYLITSCNILYCKIGARNFMVHELTDVSISDAAIFQGRLYYIRKIYDCLYRTDQLEDSSPMRFEKCIDGLKLDDQFLLYIDFSHLVGSCDDKLLYVVGRRLDMGVEDMDIFGADLCGQVWEKVYSVRGAIFLDYFGAFLTPLQPECRLQENCVYYMPYLDETHEDPDNLTIMAYDLGDECVTMLSPLPFKMYGRTRNQGTHRLRWINR